MWTVSGLYRYPLKSAAAESLEIAVMGPWGIVHDRELLIVDTAANGMFVAQRSDKGRGIAIPEMCLIQPRTTPTEFELTAPGWPEPLHLPHEPETGPMIEVQIWDDRILAVDQGDEAADFANAYLRQFRSGDYRLVRMSPNIIRNARYGDGLIGFADAARLLVIFEESLDDLNARIVKRGGTAKPMNRFRPNMVIRGLPAYAEDYIERMQIEGVEFEGYTLCVRCAIPKINQVTGVAEPPEPTATLKTYRENPDKKRGGLVFGRNFNNLNEGPVYLNSFVVPYVWDNPWRNIAVDWPDPFEAWVQQITRISRS